MNKKKNKKNSYINKEKCGAEEIKRQEELKKTHTFHPESDPKNLYKQEKELLADKPEIIKKVQNR